MATLSVLALGGVATSCTSHKSATAPAGSSPAPIVSTTISSTLTSTTLASTTSTTVEVSRPRPLTEDQAAALVASKSGPYGNWVPDTAGYRPDATLSAIVGDTPGGTASSPQQLFLFHAGSYLGTATSDTRFAFQISAQTDDTVTVTYAHYQPGDFTCCPSSEPDVVRYQWNGTRVVPLDPIPLPDQGLSG